MKRLAQIALSTFFSLVLVGGTSAFLTGCAADTLSGPSIEAYGSEDGTNRGNEGSEHNVSGDGTNRGNEGSEHNKGTDGTNRGNEGSEHNKTGDGTNRGNEGSEHN